MIGPLQNIKKTFVPRTIARNLKWFALCCAALLSLSLFARQPALPDDSSGIPLQWKAVEGARGYRVEIQNSKAKIVFNKIIQENQIKVRLGPDDYRLRITALNKFLKPDARTPWKSLKIRYSYRPQIKNLEPPALKPDSPGKITLRGKNFLTGTKVKLRGPEGNLIVLEKEYRDEQELTLLLDPARLTAGAYDLILENPGGNIREKAAALQVLPGTGATGTDPGVKGGGQKGFYWQALLPGLPEYERGQKGNSALWASSFFGLGTLSLVERQAALNALGELQGSFQHNYLGGDAGLVGQYETHRRNFVGLGVASLTIFAIHYFLYNDGFGQVARETDTPRFEIFYGHNDSGKSGDPEAYMGLELKFRF